MRGRRIFHCSFTELDFWSVQKENVTPIIQAFTNNFHQSAQDLTTRSIFVARPFTKLWYIPPSIFYWDWRALAGVRSLISCRDGWLLPNSLLKDSAWLRESTKTSQKDMFDASERSRVVKYWADWWKLFVNSWIIGATFSFWPSRESNRVSEQWKILRTRNVHYYQ